MAIGSVSTALDGRKAAVLRGVVRDFVRTGQPVGSGRLVGRFNLTASSATIRNEMGWLEDAGFLAQPHTSAGRIPTDAGYRWFVDNWPGPQWPHLSHPAKTAIERAVATHIADLEHTLDSISQVLSKITESAALAVAPPSSNDKLSRMELIMRDPTRATLLLIASNGEVEKGIVEFKASQSEEALYDLCRRLNAVLDAVAFEDLSGKLNVLAGSVPEVKAIQSKIVEIMRERAEGRVFHWGAANIAAPDKFPDLTAAHAVLEVLEHPSVFSNLIDNARMSGAVLVFIGREVPVQQMQSCSVIFAPYQVGGRTGSVGIIGPTRMDYPHTISAVDTVASRLTELLAV